MTNFDIIIQALDWIEERLKEEITVSDISERIGYSLFHFIRLFNGVTGWNPKEYIQNRRLTEASYELAHTDRRIIDIAFDYRFGDHETFTRSFKRVFGMSPSDYRKNLSSYQLPLLNRICAEELRMRSRKQQTEPEIVELGVIRLSGMMTLVNSDTSVITTLWAKLMPDISKIPNRTNPNGYYGVSFWPSHCEDEEFFHFIGIETSTPELTPLNMVSKTIPAARYLKFVHRGRSRDVVATYDYIYREWLPRSQYRLCVPYEFEYCGERYFGPDNEASESEIYIPVGM